MANLPSYAEHLLPSTQTPLEKIFAAAAEKRIVDIPAPINTIKHPYEAPAAFLSALAFEVGVDLWDESWDELKKRKVIADTIRIKKILGTIEAVRSYVEIEDGKLVDYVVPPQTPFVSKALSDAEYATWLGQLPQIRVYYGDERSSVAPGQSFVGRCFVGSTFLKKDAGRDLLGRHAYLYDPGTNTQTKITLADLGIGTSPATISEQVFVPGASSKYEAFTGRYVGRCYLSAAMTAPKTVSYTLNQDLTNQIPDIGSLVLALGESAGAATTRYDRVSVTGTLTPGEAVIGHSFIGHAFAMKSDAEIDFYDRIFLADQSVPAPATKGTTYVGHSRLEMQPYRAEMLIDAQESAPPSRAFQGRFVGHCYVAKQDNTKRDRILTAIELAKAGRDRVFVDFQVTETITFGDAPAFDGSATFGQRIPRVRL